MGNILDHYHLIQSNTGSHPHTMLNNMVNILNHHHLLLDNEDLWFQRRPRLQYKQQPTCQSSLLTEIHFKQFEKTTDSFKKY